METSFPPPTPSVFEPAPENDSGLTAPLAQDTIPSPEGETMPNKEKESGKPRSNPVRVPVRISAKSTSPSKATTPTDAAAETERAALNVPPPTAATTPISVSAKEEPPQGEPSSPEATSAPGGTVPRAPLVAPLRPPGSEVTPTAPTPAIAPSSENRTPLLSEVLGWEPAATGAPENDRAQKSDAARPRKSGRFGTLVMLIMGTNLFILAAAGLWFYNQILMEIDSRVSDAGLRSSQAASMSLPGGHAAAAKGGADVGALEVRLQDTEKQLSELRQLEAETSQILSHLSKPAAAPALREPKPDIVVPAANELKKDLAQNKDEVEGLKKRLGDLEAQLKDTTFRLKDLIVAMKAASAQKPAPAAALPESSIPGGVPINEQSPAAAPLSPSESELILLKERNRLTAFADEAIATADRAPLTTLWDSLADPRLKHLVHAVETEILRVRNFYLSGSRLTRYEIPVAELFPGSPSSMRDTDLKDEQLISLLNDPKQPWQTRMKAGWILGRKPKSPAVVEALLRSVKEDQNLDVVKESTFGFQRLTGFETRLFEPPALMEAWWKEYGHPSGAAPTTAQATPAKPSSPSPAETIKKADPASPKNNIPPSH